MKRFSVVFGCMLCMMLLMTAVDVQAMTLDWKAYETEHFIVYFPDGYQYQAQETAYYLEKLLPRVQKITGNERYMKTRVIVQDVGIDSNGYANPMIGKIGIFTNPPTSGGSLAAHQSWFRLVSGHELTHMNQLTNYSGAGSVLPTVFGNVMAGNLAVPGWITEGITVYNESTLSPYEGRMNDGYYDALIAAKVKEGTLPNILEAAYPHGTYPTGQWYLYGGAFFRYLAETYGEEKIAQFFDTNGTSLLGALGAMAPSIGIDRAAEKVFGKTFPELFDAWIAAEKEEHRNWMIEGATVLADEERGYFYDLNAYRGKLYYIRGKVLTPGPYSRTRDLSLMEWNPVTKEERVLMQFAGLSEARMQIVNNRIYLLTAETTSGFANVEQRGLGGTGVLYSYDLGTGARNKLLTDTVKAFGVMPNGDIIVSKPRKGAFGSEIWKYNTRGMVQLGVLDQIVAEMQWYRDGFVIVSKPNLGSWNINRLELDSLAVKSLVNTPWAEFALALEGDLLYYTANYDREYAIYQYNLSNGEVNRVSKGNFAMNSAILGNDLYFRGITAEGDAIFKSALTSTPYTLGEAEVVQQEDMKAFAANLKEVSAVSKSYLNLLKPYNRFFPVLAAGEDGLGLNQYSLSYSPFRGIDVHLNIGELMPLELGISNRIVNVNRDRETILTAYYPLHTSSQYGLTSVSLSGSTNLLDRTVGEVDAIIQLPRQTVNLAVQGSLDGGVAAGAGYAYMLDHGLLQVRASTFDQFDAAVEIRGMGYFGGMDVSGNTLSFDVTHKLMEVRKGFWDMSLFLADVYGNLFMDHTSLEGGQSSIGAEVMLEMGAGFGATLTPKVGLAYSGNFGVRPMFGMNVAF